MHVSQSRSSRQGAPGTIRCIETRWSRTPPDLRDTRQGTPSTIRCIETSGGRGSQHRRCRSQGAPSTIRCIETTIWYPLGNFASSLVREHPAPSGALRQHRLHRARRGRQGQGAPSTIRCIETRLCPPSSRVRPGRQGAPSTIRCIETRQSGFSRSPSHRVREHPAPSGALRL